MTPSAFSRVAPLMLGLVFATTASAQQAAPEGSRGSAIKSVEIFADRAIVSREASAQLKQGSNRIAFSGLPGWLDEDSIRLSVEAKSGVAISYVRVTPPYVPPALENESATAERQLRQTRSKVDTAHGEIGALRAQIEYLRRLSVSVSTVQKDLDKILAQSRHIQATIIKMEEALIPIENELKARENLLKQLAQRAEAKQRAVVVDIDSRSEMSTTLTLHYTVPGAFWTPVHELRMSRTGNTVALTSYALVSQVSGEDWTDVSVSFSTTRPSKRPISKALEALAPGNAKGLATAIGGHGRSFEQAHAYLQEVSRLYFAGETGVTDSTLAQSWKDLQRMSAESATLFDRLQANGMQARYKAEARVSISSDGQRVRVPLGEIQPASQQRIVGAPAYSLDTARTLTLRNVGSNVLLPGPVQIFEDARFLGTSSIPFVEKTHTFTIFLESSEEVTLSRIIDRKQSSIKRDEKQTTLRISYLLRAENLSYKPVALTLADRIPAAYRDLIRVSDVSAVSGKSKATKPSGGLSFGSGNKDADAEVKILDGGLIRWMPKVQPRADRSIRISFTVSYPPQLLAAAPSTTKAAGDKEKRPPISSKVSEDVKSDLRRLEHFFK